MALVKLTLGDCSQDGHGITEDFICDVNKPIEEIRAAYKASCKLVGVQFNHSRDFTGGKLPRYGSALHICTEYGDCYISDSAKQKLIDNGIDVDNYMEGGKFYGSDFADLIMDFIKLSLPDLIWSKANIPSINDHVAISACIGYGLYF